MQRRRFLQLSTCVVSLYSASLYAEDSDIVVIGAGLAGLRAAEVLRAAGRRVVVLEAQERPGGRVKTIRAPFDDGLFGEAGAIRIASAHQAVLRTVRAHRLGLVPFHPQGADMTVIAGKRVAGEPDTRTDTRLQLRPDERGLTQRQMLERYVGKLPADLGDPSIPVSQYARWKAYDAVSWPQWLQSRGASPAAVTYMTLGADSNGLSALYVLRQFAMLATSTQYYKIQGGMDRLPEVMARALGDIVRYEAPVTRVTRAATGVTVEYRTAGRPARLTASRVIFTVPASTMRQIEIRPRLARVKDDAINRLAYYSGVRVLLQSNSRFWRAAGQSGAARTDKGTEVWDATHDIRASRGILAATTGGAIGRDALTMTPEKELALGRQLVADAFPPIGGAQFEKGIVHHWNRDRWAQGAFLACEPGQMTSLLPLAAAADDRLHFAGEHTSPWMGWMEGALESGERAAKEAMNAARFRTA